MPTERQITDIHAHVLPGLDDGPADLGSSLAMCRLYDTQGVRTVVATPHMADPNRPVSAEAVRSGVRGLQAACRAEGLHLRILPGADVRLQPETLDDLDAGRLLTLGDGGRFLLLELPLQIPYPLDDLLFQLEVRGVKAILTHPERHPSLSGDLRRLRRLVEGGCLVQITAASLLGAFGQDVRRSAERALRRGLVHVVASDAHGPEGTRRPQFFPARKRLVKLVGEEGARELLCLRPTALLAPRCAPSPTGDERSLREPAGDRGAR